MGVNQTPGSCSDRVSVLAEGELQVRPLALHLVHGFLQGVLLTGCSSDLLQPGLNSGTRNKVRIQRQLNLETNATVLSCVLHQPVGELGEPRHQHVQQRAVLIGPHLKSHYGADLHRNTDSAGGIQEGDRRLRSSADHLPVAVLDARVADGVQDGHVQLELVHLPFEGLGHTPRPRQRRQRLGQLVQRPPHHVQLVGYLLRIQLGKRPWRSEVRKRDEGRRQGRKESRKTGGKARVREKNRR